MWLRVARKGLAPGNDFSADAPRRSRAWDNEVKTFLNAFGADDEAMVFQGAEGLYYFADCYWFETVRPTASNRGDDDKTALQKSMGAAGVPVALHLPLGEQ